MKVAVIGAGYWGKNHVREYCNLGQEVVVCDIDPEKLGQIKKDFKVGNATTKLSDIISDKKTIAASVCVPNQFHFETAKTLLEHGKHILLEKPMTLSYSSSLELVKLAKKKNLVLNCGHIFRFNNAVKKLREMVQAKEFGRIYLCKLAWTNMENIFPDRDILFDLAPHPFDIVNFVFEKNPQQVYAIGKDFRREGGEEAAFVNAVLDGILVNLEISWITPKKSRTITLVGEKKTAFVDALQQTMDVFDIATNKIESIPLQPSNPLAAELKQFIDCIEKKSVSPASGEAGAEVIHIIEKTVESMRSKKIVTM